MGRKHYSAGQIHSEAEASDLEPPMTPGPGSSYRQAAMDTIHGEIIRRIGPPPGPGSLYDLRQPGHRDKVCLVKFSEK